jgi:CheY-like chemotaxis protein
MGFAPSVQVQDGRRARMGTTPLRVLVVDDNRDTARMLQLLVEGQGYEMEAAHTGRAAIEIARRAPPDVVLLDIMLTDLRGDEVAREIRPGPGWRGLAIVALSGCGASDLPSIAAFDRYFQKPVDLDVLLKYLAGLEGKRDRPR